jgi:LSD1 subclass zinc finger protein
VAHRNALPWLPLHVDDYLEDPNVIGMTAAAEGCYIRLLCRMWRSRTPGTVMESLVPEMCGLHRIADPAERDAVLAMMARCFIVAGDSGMRTWTQKRLGAEYKRACGVYESRKLGARKANAAKEIARSAHADRNGERTPTATVTATVSAPSARVDVDLQREKQKGLESSQPSSFIKPHAPAPPPPPINATSTPHASHALKPNAKPSIDPNASERARCHGCRTHFIRPIGSQRSLCANCHADRNAE